MSKRHGSYSTASRRKRANHSSKNNSTSRNTKPKRGRQGAAAAQKGHPLAGALKALLEKACRPARKVGKVLWTPLMLSMAAIFMGWDAAPTSTERLENAVMTLWLMMPRRKLGSTYQGFMKALRRNAQLPALLAGHWRTFMAELARDCWLREGWCAFAADGSKFGCPRTQRNEEEFGHGGRKNGPPQQLLTLLWHMGCGLPWGWTTAPVKGSDERGQLQHLLPLLPSGALLVADAGFVGYEMMKRITADGRHLLIRAGRNVSLLSKLGYYKREGAGTVYLWPKQTSAGGDRTGRKLRQRQAPLVLRLIRLHRDGKPDTCLLTDVLDEKKLSAQSAGVLYGLRWEIEVGFRGIKRTMQQHTLRSDAPTQAKLELEWVLISFWALGLLSVQSITQAGHDPLSWSVALALRAMRHQMRQPGCEDLAEALSMAVHDAYQRQGPKAIRHWPRKRDQHPPGEPKVLMASADEVQLAKEYHGQKAAA
jgi:hypothetical protein